MTTSDGQTNTLFCSYGSFVLFAILWDEYARLLGEHFLHEETLAVVKGEPMVVVQYLIHAEAIVTALFVVCSGMGLALLCFLVFHLYLVTVNTTTNEFFKRRALRRKQSVAVKQDKTTGSSTESTTTEGPTCTLMYTHNSFMANWREVWRPRYLAKLQSARTGRSHRQRGVKSA
ncbi:hypothetical protein BBJ28_00010458 [Nothophytophthora sp. Chile5]|nr:hypothetical protein BBJ28_00010458 [Nothophytophthora sp. Chile5]